MTESWSGSAWSVVPSPSPGSVANALNGISCTAADSCTAVGNYLAGTTQLTLIESWNGTAWSVVPSPNAPDAASSLGGVSCPVATTCMAAGWRKGTSSGSDYRTLAELGT